MNGYQQLNFPNYKFRLRKQIDEPQIFDPIRKKFVKLTPEEWVRQHCLHYLHQELGYPLAVISIERQLKINQTIKRYDIVVFNSDGKPDIAVECKAPDVKINQDVFDQLAVYNRILNVRYLFITNGLEHFAFEVIQNGYHFLESLPKKNNF